MMRRLVVAVIPLLFAAGCFNPTFKERLACGTQGECPPGQTCGSDLYCHAVGASIDDAGEPASDARPDAPPVGCESDQDCQTPPDACALAGTCDLGAKICIFQPLDCADTNGCTNDSCDPVTGCVNANNTAACNDNNMCTTADTCAGGACVGGAAPNCNDNNGCTNDSCNSGTGCVHTNNTAACNDNNMCTTADTCANGSCAGGPAPNCNDNNPCTTDTCNPATGCVHTNISGGTCNDNNACTSGDTCTNGTCGGTTISCNDNNACTTDSCNTSTGCVNANNTLACNDNNLCTTSDVCGGGICRGTTVSCNDNNSCTNDSCSPLTGTCSNVASTNNCCVSAGELRRCLSSGACGINLCPTP